MQIGLPTDIKNQAFCVGITPDSVAEIPRAGRGELVQAGAGVG